MSKTKTLINSNMFYKIIDLLNLLLVMFLSMRFFDSVMFGLISYLFMSLLIMVVQIFIKLKSKIYSKSTILLVLIITLINSILIAINKDSFINIMNQKEGISLFGFTFVLLLRGLITNDLICKLRVKRYIREILRVFIHVCLLYVIISFLLDGFASVELIMSIAIVILSTLGMIIVQLLNKESIIEIQEENKIKNIYSYKILSRSLIFTYLGFYLCSLLFIVNLTFNSENLYVSYIALALYFGIGAGISYIFYRFVSKMHVYENMYFIGFVLSFGAYLLLNTLESYNLWLIILYLIGTSFMFTSIKSIQKKIKLLNGINDININNEVLLQNKTVNHNISFSLSLGIALLFVYLYDVLVVKEILTYIPLVLMFIGLVYSLKQPIDKDTYPLLVKYSKGQYEINYSNKIKNKFVDKFKRRVFIIFLRRIVKFVMRYKIVGQENVEDKDLPAIFVSNHGEYYGPVAAVANMPYSYRPWIESQLLEVEKGYPYTYKYTFSLITWLPVFIRKFLAKSAVMLTSSVFTAFDPIPVYRSELRSIFKTFNISVEALKQGDSILLFPESTHNTEDGKYAKNGQIGDFFTGFAHIGVKYFEETGKQIKFYPIYLDKKKRKFIIGKGIEFNSKNERAYEKKRLAEELRESMENLRTIR